MPEAGTSCRIRLFSPAMFENRTDEPEIARHEVSEDGLNWRPYDPERDHGALLHKRIEFAPIEEATGAPD